MIEDQNEPTVLAEVSLPELIPEEPGASDIKNRDEKVLRIAQEVLAGRWGRGHDRERRLRAAGHNVIEVNLKINEILHR